MPQKEHTLIHDFPELAERIKSLKKTDSHFAGMCDKYDDLEHTIHLMESGTKPYTDAELDSLRKHRLKIKDEISSLMHKAA